MIEEKLGYQFKNKNLLQQALTHKSFQSIDQNERLEFLGDAVIDMVLAEVLMEKFPLQDEGRLSKKRAGLVNESSLAQIALALDLGKDIRLGKSEIQSEGSKKPSILSGTLEALIGALYLDAGFEKTREFIFKLYQERLAAGDADQDFSADFKTRLQELVQENQKTTPTYAVISETMEGLARVFKIQVEVNGVVLGSGLGASKKAAEQEAAQVALKKMALKKSENV